MATNTYTYGSLGQRWTVGTPTSKSNLDIARVKNDANRWTLTQLVTDPDNDANFALKNGTTATTQSASDNSTKIATTAYADSAGGTSISFTNTTASGILAYSSATNIKVATDIIYDQGVREFSGSTQGALRVSSTNDNKIFIGGSDDPLVYWREGSTNKVSESWDSTNHYFKIAQLQDSTDLRIGAGASGLQWTYVEGSSPATKTVWHSGNSFTFASSTFTFTGGITASGDIESTSDERVKTDIKTIPDALDKVLQLRGASFTKYNKESIGLIAQEVETVIPEVVTVPDGDDGLRSIAYGNIVGLLIEAVKEQQGMINKLKEALNGSGR